MELLTGWPWGHADRAGPPLRFMLNLGILLALLCAVVTQLGFLYKHKGANEAAAVDVRHPLRTVKSLFSQKWFAIGMAVATHPAFLREREVRPAPGQVEQVGEMLVGAVLPARAPHALEGRMQPLQVLGGGPREVMREAVDERESALGRFGLIEAEKGDDTIYVDQEERRGWLHKEAGR